MRYYLPLLFGTILAFGAEAGANTRGFVHETEAELSGAADLDGDGRFDVLVADREEGQLRIGRRASDGRLHWQPAMPTGLPSVDGLALGALHSPEMDTFAIASVDGNRLVRGRAEREQLDLSTAHVSGVGPGAIAAVPVANSGTADDRFDLFVASERNATEKHPEPFLFETVENDLDTTALATLFKRASELEFGQANRVRVSADTQSWPPLLAVHETEPEGEGGVLRFYNSADGRYEPQVELEMPRFWTYAAGRFGSMSSSTVLIGGEEPVLLAYILDDSGSELGVVDLEEVPVAEPVEQIVVLEEGDPGRFLAIYREGRGAEVFAWSPGRRPESQETFSPEEGRELTGAAADGEGGVALFEGAGGRSTHFAVHVWDGENFSRIQSGGLPSLDEGEGTVDRANIFLFAQEPFVDPDAEPIALYRAGDWTVNARLNNGEVEVETLQFVDSGTGLELPETESVSGVPGAANFVLTNQLREPDQSLYSLASAVGEQPSTVNFDPSGGSFDGAVTLELTTSFGDGSRIFYDTGDGIWRQYESDDPPRLFRSATVHAYAQATDGTSTPIELREFTIGANDPERDSDGDGVPDFVELHHGLDPVRSGPDADGDGATDLDELLAGTDPADRSSVPEEEVVDPAAAWDALLVLRGYDPGAYPADDLLNAREKTRARLHRMDGRLYGRGAVDGEGVARVDAVPVEPRAPISVGSSAAARFGLAGLGSGDESGHEVVGLVLEPELEAPSLPEFDFEGSEPTEADVDRWVSEMQAHLEERGRTESQQELVPLDTLVFVLFERFVGKQLDRREVIDSPRANLAPFRSFGGDREEVTLEMLRDLSRPGPGGETAYELEAVAGNLKDAVEDESDGKLEDLRDLTRDIYDVAADGPPLPLEALREFLETGGLPEPYASGVMLSDSELSDARSAADSLVAQQDGRDRQTLTLEVTETSFDGPCVQLLDPPLDQDVSLVGPDGTPYSFARSLKLLPGSIVTVDGYMLSDSARCGGSAMEVISAVLDFLATPSPDDADGNLLSDDWEEFFFGETGRDPFEDSSGNGYTNLQHMLEGVDPRERARLADVEPIPSGPPRLQVEESEEGLLQMEWSWPEAYRKEITFGVRSSSDLQSFNTEEIEPEYLGNGRFRATIDPSEYGDAAFFRAFLSLD